MNSIVLKAIEILPAAGDFFIIYESCHEAENLNQRNVDISAKKFSLLRITLNRPFSELREPISIMFGYVSDLVRPLRFVLPDGVLVLQLIEKICSVATQIKINSCSFHHIFNGPFSAPRRSFALIFGYVSDLLSPLRPVTSDGIIALQLIPKIHP